MAMAGAMNPLYRVGADAMMADLIPSENRPEAYSLLRMSNNLGVAIGPAIGGFIAARSYGTVFALAAAGMITYGLLLAIFGKETLPEVAQKNPRKMNFRGLLSGYKQILRDSPFITFTIGFAFTMMCSAVLWVLLSVYAKTNFGLSESQYGWIPTTNAIMVVTLQILVTRWTKKKPPLWVMALGAFLYTFGVMSIAWGSGFWSFWLSMVVMTFGELVIVPTATTYAANLAPVDMRGRYMSIYGLSWSFAMALGPLSGGMLNDALGPQYIWYGGGLIGSIGTIIYLVNALQKKVVQPN
jgi:MFS family permease